MPNPRATAVLGSPAAARIRSSSAWPEGAGRFAAGAGAAGLVEGGASAAPPEPKDHRQPGFTVVQRSTGQTRQIVHTTTDRTDGRLLHMAVFLQVTRAHNFGNRQAPRGRVGVMVVPLHQADRQPDQDHRQRQMARSLSRSPVREHLAGTGAAG